MTRRVDAVVVGAGIHGAGVAQALAAEGQTVLVLEQTAPAAGTSSRSSKLVHGGLRYLESMQFGLVRESLAERERLLRVAPDLVRRVPFFIPVYRHTRRRPWQIAIGLTAYSALAGFRENTAFRRVPRTDWGAMNGLATAGLDAVFEYPDAQTDDAALTRSVLASARALGADLVCPAQFKSAERHDRGFRVAYESLGKTEECDAATLVNAAGPWVNHVLMAVSPLPTMVTVDLVQGTHVVLDVPWHGGVYYVESPRDGRAIFILPWHGNAMIGTTETPYRGNPMDVFPLDHEVAYLRDVARNYFPSLEGRVLRAFAGLRVLPTGNGSLFHRARDTVLRDDGGSAPRLVSIYGGKLTTFGLTAQRVAARLRGALPVRKARANATTLELTPA